MSDTVFSERLKALLESSKINQKEFAQKLGITEASASRYINGSRNPNFETLRNICKTFNISADWLLGISKR